MFGAFTNYSSDGFSRLERRNFKCKLEGSAKFCITRLSECQNGEEKEPRDFGKSSAISIHEHEMSISQSPFFRLFFWRFIETFQEKFLVYRLNRLGIWCVCISSLASMKNRVNREAISLWFMCLYSRKLHCSPSKISPQCLQPLKLVRIEMNNRSSNPSAKWRQCLITFVASFVVSQTFLFSVCPIGNF